MKTATRLTFTLFLTSAALVALPCTGATDQASSPGECSDAWTATSIMNAPAARIFHSAVWTGSELIVWGGFLGNVYTNTGARYNPSTDTWTPTSTINAPKGRQLATAVWTGTEMIVWGGSDGSSALNTGGRYNPSTDTWTPTSVVNAPSARSFDTAVWTGSEMIVWGGTEDMTGGRYNPVTDTWTPISTTNAPEGRISHTTVWTGSEMIIWGGFSFTGFNNYLNSGARYNPTTDSWTATSVTNAPAARWHHTAVWTGSEMVIWGGEVSSTYFNTGARYNPGTDSWTATTVTNAPTARKRHTAVWTGSEMIVWGGAQIFTVNTGGRYNPGTDSWTPTSTTDAPLSREDHTAVWTGSQMIVWAGWTGNSRPTDRTGGRYCGAETATSVNGSGSIDGQGDQATFNFHATAGDRPSGSLTFSDPAAAVSFSRAKVRTLTFTGTSATFGGNARLGDGSRVTYSVNVSDNSSDGSSDTFTISLSNGYLVGGTLTSGDIAIQ
jgi:N-acetylneuraminic acid mutarotase